MTSSADTLALVTQERPGRGPLTEVFAAFLRLGLTSFGGPVAHLAYFREEFVVRRRWLGEGAYADLIALCQFLPGPASSQAGFALGVLRGGLAGGILAWSAFTLPSAFALVAFAFAAGAMEGWVAAGALHGLKLVAVAVVAHAVLGMARSLTPDWQRMLIGLAAAAIALIADGTLGQVAAILPGAAAGLLFLRRGIAPEAAPVRFRISVRGGATALALFALLLVAGPLLHAASSSQAVAMFDSFYRSGALVFGGGHVLLPLLEAEVVATGRVSEEDFLAGYGATQAVPGPLFTFAAYLGAVSRPEPNGIAGAAIALVAVFLPGMLLIYGALPFWNALRTHPAAGAAISGANAAVVGILAAALYSPVAASALLGLADVAVALAGFLALTLLKVPSWVLVLLMGGIGIGMAAL